MYFFPLGTWLLTIFQHNTADAPALVSYSSPTLHFFNTYEPTVYKIPDLHICFFTQNEDSLTAGTSNFLSSQTR